MKCEETVRLILHCNILQRGRTLVIFLDSNSATSSHKAPTHGPGRRTAHASSIDEKGIKRSYSQI